MKKKLLVLLTTILALSFTACGKSTSSDNTEVDIQYKYLSAEECGDTLDGLDEYYSNISQKALDFLGQKKGETTEEYREFSKEQALEFTDDQKNYLDTVIANVEEKINDAGLQLPDTSNISIGLTTTKEAVGAAGYTHGTTIFFSEYAINTYMQDESYEINAEILVAHEIFHCLTRNNPDFRKDMYSIIGFTVNDSDFDIPEEIAEQVMVNPDVENHDSYAEFTINGEKKKCYLVFLTSAVFENPGDSFFDDAYTGLVDIESGELYTIDDTSDFYDVVGYNTTYCEDPEECMATNFSMALVYGEQGPDGTGYNSPEIIENIISYLKK